MNKKVFYFIALMALVFSGCGGDDDDPVAVDRYFGAKPVGTNQMAIGQTVQDIIPSLAIRPSKTDEPGAYYLDVFASKSRVARFDLGIGLIGKTIDLGNPIPTVGEHQFSFGFMTGEEEPIFNLDVYDNKVWSSFGQNHPSENVSPFRSGALSLSHDSQSAKKFLMTLYGQLTDGRTVSLNVVINEEDIEYWR